MRKTDYFILILALTICPCITTFAQTPDAKTEKELLKIQDEWAAARVNRDVPYLEKLYAKEFRITNIGGSSVTRQQDIDNFASGDLRPESVVDEEIKVAVYGNTAVVTGIENVKGTYKGNRGEFSIRFTNVFVRRDKRWQLVVHHGTQIPKK